MLASSSQTSQRCSGALCDSHGRRVQYFRLSITDRCNLRCLYCRSQIQHKFIPHPQVLRYEEILRLTHIMVAAGTRKLRLTGGEPFARKGCDRLLLMLRERFPTLDLRLTTNGTLVEPYIPLLKRVGVGAVNLSLDSFNRETFAHVTGRDFLPAVLSTLDSLLSAGISVKLNAVAMRGINDRQLDDFVHAARTLPVDVRFIEFMPMGNGTLWGPETFWPADEIYRDASRLAELRPETERREHAGPARMFKVAGGKGRLGFISAVSSHFCSTCNRLRLTCDGHLRTCLFDDREYPLLELLRRQDCTDAELDQVVRQACLHKPIGAEILKQRAQGKAVAEKQMVGIGG